jgi:hypothetical protein
MEGRIVVVPMRITRWGLSIGHVAGRARETARLLEYRAPGLTNSFIAGFFGGLPRP